MAFDFKKTAQQETALSDIMVGREKLSTDEITGQDLTIVAFDFAPKFTKEGKRIVDPETGEQDEFGVVVFKEYPAYYYSVGTIFTKICKVWAASFPSAKEASAELQASGGVKVRFTASKAKNGNNLTTVDILD